MGPPTEVRFRPAAWRPLYLLNPAAGLVDAFRGVVLGIPLDADAVRTAALVTVVVLPVVA